MPTIIEVLLWLLGIGVVGFLLFVGLTWYGIRRFSRSKRVRGSSRGS
jgi:flagellar biogenesis protein FliO